MKRTAYWVMVMWMLHLAVNCTPNAQPGEPKLLIPETAFDFGYAPTKSTLSHYYLVKNVGTDTLKIKEVKPG